MGTNRSGVAGLALSALGAALLLLAAGCGGGDGGGSGASPGTAPGAAAPTTLVFARGSDSVTLDPATVTDGESAKVITNIFDTLVRFRAGSLEIEPGLAESWDASPDGLTWTFHLRQAKFHDGTPVDADAVVFSFLRQKDADHPAHTDACPYWEDNFQVVREVVAVDPRTVRIRLERQFAPFESAMALFTMSIVSPTAWNSEGLDAKGKCRYRFGEQPVGSGPFRFVRWNRDDSIVLERNPDYWDGAPEVSTLIFKVVKQNQQRLLMAETGQAQIVDGLNPADGERAKTIPSLQVLEQPGMNVVYLAFNTLKKPFDDVRVRRALALAIDKAGIRDAAYDGAGEIASVPIPPGLPGWKKIEDRKRDLDGAQALLAEAGFPQGFTFKLWVMDNARPYMPRPKDVAIQVSQDMRQIGVTAEIEVVQWARYLPDTRNGAHEACLLGWSADYGDADNFLYVLLSKETARIGSANNVSFWRDDQASDWLEQARITRDRAERNRLYGLVQDRVFDQVPMVPILHLREMRVLGPNVKGYSIYPAGGEYLGRVRLE